MDPTVLLGVAILVLGGLGLGFRWGRSRARPPGSPERGPAPPAADGSAGEARAPSQIYPLASQLYDFYQASAHPADLLSDATFREGVALLRHSALSGAELAGYFAGDNAVIACMAAQALRERGELAGAEETILDSVGSVAPWAFYFGLVYLAETPPPERSIVGRVLVQTLTHLGDRLCRQFLTEFLEARAKCGEAPRFGADLPALEPEQLTSLTGFLQRLDPKRGEPLLADLERWQREQIDRGFLASVGRLWDPVDEADLGIVWHDALRAQVAPLVAELTAERRRSVLLVGESGVGKTKLSHAVAHALQRSGWIVLEAGPSELVAGQIFIGQFEERMRRLLDQLRGQRILWLVPDFHGLSESGTHHHSTTSALDLLLPHVESGAVAVLAECRPGPFERLVLAKPRLTTALSVTRLAPLSAAQTLELARRWWEGHAEAEGREQLLGEAWELAQQYLGEHAAPGNLMRLLDVTWQRLVGSERAGLARIHPDDLITTLARITGLPHQILDERSGLDLDGLREHFARRVIGQPEAVDCLVERVAMLKAGLTDPTRPTGVFLFAGPTGTGKTEIAKTLAQYLFGSSERMIRVDMSELQSPDDLGRLVGSDRKEAGGALVDRIREQPFSLVLLDEFEKAHPRAWDLFLQVFDDGRLTDRSGQVADFRYAIVILTSNLGSVVPSGQRLGFSSEPDRFSSRDVMRAVEGAFRPEFLNRLDRVVVFRPFDRETMRGILRRELEDVLQRRGLRARPWAVEWDPGAIEFLLEAGFSPTLGARPLKRAVERHLLAPLARTIVRHEFPKGDQFLYVTLREGALVVQFIDPDAPPDAASDEDPGAAAGAASADLAAIARDARGASGELELLESRFEDLRVTVESPSWRERKETALAMTGLPDFWKSPDRFEILGQYEYQGRIEAGVRRTGSLLGRLRSREREHLPRDLLSSVARTLFLLDIARADVEQGRPQAAFVAVEAAQDAGLPDPGSNRFAERIGRMYLAWAERRAMRVENLSEQRGGDRYRLLLAVSGFGAHSILAPEDGLHVLESPVPGRKTFERSRAAVAVLPQAGDPGDGSPEALRRLAEAALQQRTTGEPSIVRRYRTDPSPLVRDGVRGWRTGRIDRVLAGDFDLMTPDAAPAAAD